ncbi:hypothetical protein MMC31_001737, partial [Peltigera leucophlebia]|nr:hypothetical protein [Peltigera leucophlebia]
CGDPSHILPPTQRSRILPPPLKRKQSRHQDTPNRRPRVDSTTAGSDYQTGDSAANEIKDARAENRGSEAGPSEARPLEQGE